MAALKCVSCIFVIVLLCQIDYLNCLQSESPINSEHRIVGGVPARIEDFPYQVLVQVKSPLNNIYMCGGSVIALDLILTAAHCVYVPRSSKPGDVVLASPSDIIVMGGHANYNLILTQGQSFNARRVKAHEKYTEKSFDYDIALIGLTGNFTLNTIRPIPMRNGSTSTNESCTVSGWGKTNSASPSASQNLMKVDIPIVDRARCKQIYRNQFTNNMICAGVPEGGKDSCQGDSGGPLVCNGQLTGVVSFGYECALPDYPGVYTEVGKFREWIEKNSATSIQSSVFCVVIILQIVSIFNNVFDK